MNKPQQLFQIIQNMGWRYFFFRFLFELKKKSGILKKSFPVNPSPYKGINLSQWRENKSPFFFFKIAEISVCNGVDTMALRQQAESILQGRFRFFSSQEFLLGKNYDWITNPDSNFKYDIRKHWTEIPDYTKEAGDIKYEIGRAHV